MLQCEKMGISLEISSSSPSLPAIKVKQNGGMRLVCEQVRARSWMVVQYKDVHMRRKDFLIGGAQFEIPHRVVRNLYNNYENLGGHMPPVPPHAYAYDGFYTEE